MRIWPRRRAAPWLMALAVLVTPLAVAGDAAPRLCAGKAIGRDGWTQVAAPDFGDTFGFATSIVAHGVLPSNPNVLLVSNGEVLLRSADAGCTWELVYSGRSDGEIVSTGRGGIREIDTSLFNTASKRVYVMMRQQPLFGDFSVNDQRPGMKPVVAVSEDGGETFTASNRGLPPLGEPVRLRVADGVDNVAYVSVTDPLLGVETLYVTRDGGDNWLRTSGDSILPNADGSMNDFAIDPGRPDHVWAWDDATLYLSRDAGASFTPVTQVTDPVSTVEFTPRGIGRLSDVRVYHASSSSSQVSLPPYLSWQDDDAVGVVTSAVPMPFVGVRVLGTAQRVFTYYPNTRTGRIIGPVDISPTKLDPVDLELGYDPKSEEVTVVGRTPTHLLLRDPTFPPPPLPPVGPLDVCAPDPLGDSAFRPSTRELVLRPGEKRRVLYDLNLPPVPSDLDVNFMSDTTGSMGGVIAGLRQDIQEIVDNICGEGVPVQFGLADFREFEGPFGGDYPYRLRLPISPVGPDLKAAIESLDTGGGAQDGSDSALEAMFQAATGAGKRDPVNGRMIIPPGEGAGWRDDSLKVIVLALDTTWREATPGYPGPAYETVVAELKRRGIKVVGLAIGARRAALGEVLRTNESDMRRLAVATGTLATGDGTDCDGDGSPEVAPGEPLVCVLDDPGADSVALGPAMTGLLAALEDRADIGIEIATDPRFVAEGGTQSRLDIDVKKPSRLAFDSYFTCDAPAYGQSTPVTVDAVSRGRVLASTQLVVRCGAPAKPAEPELPPRVFAAPVVAAALPPPPPPPAPVPVTQAQPNPNPNPNPQPNPQPNLGMVGQEQEQVEVALATVDISDETDGQAQLAMSAVREEDATVQVAAALAAVGLTAAAAYGLALGRRSAPAPVRVTVRR